MLLACLVGVASGLGAIAFQWFSQVVSHFSLTHFAGYAPSEALGEKPLFAEAEHVFLPWMVVAVMIVGGLISGTITYCLAPEAEGHGTDAVIDAFHNRRGVIRGRVPIIKTITSAITIGTGGSGGREGPIAQIGAGFASWVGSLAKLSSRDRRILLAAGMGAGVGAIFRAPLAGAVFAGEILYSDADIEADVIVPAGTASVVAYSIYSQSLSPDVRFMPLFGDDLNHAFGSPIQLLPYLGLALALGLVGVLYVKCFYGTQKLFAKLPILPHFRPAIGAGLAGLLSLALLYYFGHDQRVLYILGTGYGGLQEALNGAADFGVPLLLAIVFGKILTTSLTISSGGSGGVFGPSMVIGGSLGAAVGLGFQSLWPSLVPSAEAFAVVGMAGFFAGVGRAPISTIIMVRALTGDYSLLVPTMLVTTITFVLCSRAKLYRKQVPSRLDSAAHRGDFIVDVLEGLKVDDVFHRDPNMTLIPESMHLDKIVRSLVHTRQHYFPVVDANKKMIGIFTDDDVRSYLFNDSMATLVVAGDIMTSRYACVFPSDDLNTAMKQFTAQNIDELPVIDPNNEGGLLGMLRRRDTISAYNERLMEYKTEVDDPNVATA